MEATVLLEGLEFYAYHGLYEQEQKIGNRFVVDILAEFDFGGEATDDITRTVDYEKLYQHVKAEMAAPVKLLETLASRIIDRILAADATIQGVEVSVSKYHPPVGGRCERAKVTLKKKRG
jgi:dihydroneopterin aldolase